MNTGRFFLITTAALIGAGILTAKMAPAAKPTKPLAPRANDFASSDQKTLAMQAMIQLSREMQALDQINTAKVYMDQASNPPPGTAARALEHVADEFEQAGNPTLAAKLRAVAAQIYTEPTSTTAPAPAG